MKRVLLEVLFSSLEVQAQCTNFAKAKKLFGGNQSVATSLFARIRVLEQAETLKDIIVLPQFRFHNLTAKAKKNLEGYFAIDVKSKKDPWRIILRPLDDNKQPFDPCHIDEIAGIVEIIEIAKVSKHYE